MNKHTKLVVGFLVAVLILLIIAIASLSRDISKNSESSQNSASDIVVNANGNEIVQGDNRLYGVVDAAGNSIIEPIWEQLHFIGTEYLAATKKTDDGRRVGVLDLDGNVAAPFVYSDVHALTPSYYLASFADSEQVVLYDSAFCATDTTVWDRYSWENQLLTLTKGEDVFLFSLEEDTLMLMRIDVSRASEDVSFTVSWENVDVTLLSPAEWSHTTDMMQQLLQMMKLQDFSSLKDVTDQAHENTVLSVASLPEEKITRVAPTLYLHAERNEASELLLTWQISISVRTKDGNVEERILTAKMTRNGQEVWVVTELKIA